MDTVESSPSPNANEKAKKNLQCQSSRCQRFELTLIHSNLNFKLTRFIQIKTGKSNLVVIDVVTQAGTYVKELVHGEFNRTIPSISSIIGKEIDIIALDVMNIDLNFPKEIVR